MLKFFNKRRMFGVRRELKKYSYLQLLYSRLTTHHSRKKKTLQLPETFFLNYNSYAYCSFAFSFSAPFVPPLCVAFIEANRTFNPAIFKLSLPERSFSTTFFLVSSASYNTFISSQSSLV